MNNLINIIKKRKGLLIAIVPLALLLIHVLLTMMLGLMNPSTPSRPISTPGPTAIRVTSIPKKTQTNPPVLYNKHTTKKMLDKLKNRTPLSTQDESTKQRIIRSINNKPSVLRTDITFRVEYISGPDLFMVEIRTVDIGKGKLDAKNWLISQGFTTQGACELPVVYYLSGSVAQQLRDLGITFSPLAEGC
jgi:hypothetical protein